MATTNAQGSNATHAKYTYATVPTQFVAAAGIQFIYRL